MKSLVTLLCVLFPFASTFALTADQLSTFLGISHWETTVPLPKDAFEVSLKVIRNGKLDGVSTSGSAGEGIGESAKTKLVIMGQMGKNPAPFTIMIDRVSISVACPAPEIPGNTVASKDGAVPHAPARFSQQLPAEIGPGDYILGGEPFRNGISTDEMGKIEAYRVGYVLSIVKKSEEKK